MRPNAAASCRFSASAQSRRVCFTCSLASPGAGACDAAGRAAQAPTNAAIRICRFMESLLLRRRALLRNAENLEMRVAQQLGAADERPGRQRALEIGPVHFV